MISNNPRSVETVNNSSRITNISKLQHYFWKSKGEGDVSFNCMAYLVSAPYTKIRFDLWKQSFQDRLGFEFETGQSYIVRGKIDDTWSFEAKHRESFGAHVYVFVDREYSDVVRPGVQHKITIEEVRPDNMVEACEMSGGFFATFGLPIFRLFGLDVNAQPHNSLVEFTVRKRLASDSINYRLYANPRGHQKGCRVSLRSLYVKAGERLEVLNARWYSLNEFAVDFNQQKPRSYRNLSLSCQGDEVFLDVAGIKCVIVEPRLETFGAEAVVKAKVGPNLDPIKFVFDGYTAEGRFGDSSSLRGIHVVNGQLQFEYSRTTTDNHLRRMPISGRESSQSGIIVIELCEGVSILEEFSSDLLTCVLQNSPSDIENGQYTLCFGNSFREMIRQELGSLYGREPLGVKGYIGERIVQKLSTCLGLEFVTAHPKPQCVPNDVSGRLSPDLLVRSKSTGRLGYVEIKWWLDIDRATVEATRQVGDYLTKLRLRGDERVVDSYIAILDWNVDELEGRLIFRKVLSME